MAIGVPIALVVLALIVIAVLSGMPYSHNSDNGKLTRAQQPAPPVINEQESGTATTARIGEAEPDNSTPAGRGVDVVPVTTSTIPPNVATAPATPPPMAASPSPRVQSPPPVAVPSAPGPAQSAPPPARTATTAPMQTPRPAQQPVRQPPADIRASRTTTTASPVTDTAPPAKNTAEITEEDAEQILRDYVVSRDYYQAGGADCVGVTSDGYSNRGYTIDVVDRCGSRGRLGRWRVDALTREVFVQKSDGRYLKP